MKENPKHKLVRSAAAFGAVTLAVGATAAAILKEPGPHAKLDKPATHGSQGEPVGVFQAKGPSGKPVTITMLGELWKPDPSLKPNRKGN